MVRVRVRALLRPWCLYSKNVHLDSENYGQYDDTLTAAKSTGYGTPFE